MMEDPSERKYQVAETFRDDWVPLSMRGDDTEALRRQTDYWRGMYHDEQEHVARLTAPRQHSIVSHLREWGLLYLAGALIVFLAFALGVWRGHESVNPYSQDNFPCQEDEVLGYSPAFGPERVGCLHIDLLVDEP